VEGAHVLGVEEILGAARLEKDAEAYPEKIDEAVRAVTELYRRRGYENAKTRADPAETNDGLHVALHIDEGAPTRIAAISTAGARGESPTTTASRASTRFTSSRARPEAPTASARCSRSTSTKGRRSTSMRSSSPATPRSTRAS